MEYAGGLHSRLSPPQPPDPPTTVLPNIGNTLRRVATVPSGTDQPLPGYGEYQTMAIVAIGGNRVCNPLRCGGELSGDVTNTKASPGRAQRTQLLHHSPQYRQPAAI